MTAVRRLFLLAAFAVPAILYVASVSPEPASWDTAELQGVPYILGISHPTGFPFYVLLGYAWSHLVAFGSVAWRMNALSGVAIAVAAAAAYAVALEFGASLPVALLATLWFAFTQNVWSHAIRAEAQDLAVACCALAIYAFVRWMRGGGGVWFAAAFALCGLGMAAHPNALWILPAFFVGAAVAKRRPPLRLVLRSHSRSSSPDSSLYLYLPLRSAYVATHHLDPAAAAAGRRRRHLLELQRSANAARPRARADRQRIGDARRIFSHRSIRCISKPRSGRSSPEYTTQYDAFATLLIFGGFVAAWRRDWRSTLVLCIACTAGLLFSVVYPNESDVGRYRLLASWLAVPLLGALTPQSSRGLALLLQGT